MASCFCTVELCSAINNLSIASGLQLSKSGLCNFVLHLGACKKLFSLIWVLLLPVMPFKLTVLRYDCIIANFAKGFCWISRIGRRHWANFCSKVWILQPHMSKLLAASVYQEVFFYQTVLLTNVTESLGNIRLWDKNIFYQCCLST